MQLATFAGGGAINSPDSSAVVYVDAFTGIHSVPATGGIATSLVEPMAPADRLALIAISPDSAAILYRSATAVTGGMYVAPLVPENDSDGDGVVFPCDCDPDDDTVYPGAPEINDGQDNQCAGEPGWGQIDELSGQATVDASGTLT